ncbi:MAG: cation:proton antiporter [Candidatus Hadarchaeales archaeon]
MYKKSKDRFGRSIFFPLILTVLVLTASIVCASQQSRQTMRREIKPFEVLLLVGVILVFSFLGDKIFEVSGFPDVVPLIILGILLGPITGLINTEILSPWIQYFATLVLVLILFDSGMKLDMKQVFVEGPRAIALAIVGYVFSSITVATFAAIFLWWGKPFIYSIILGAILGGTSSVIVIAIVSRMKVSKACSTIVTIESVITDIISVVLVLAALKAVTGAVGFTEIAKDIGSRFLIGMAVGLFAGLLCLSSLYGLRGTPNIDVLLFALVLIVYAFSEWIGGSGALSSLFFGLILGNERGVYRAFRVKRGEFVDAGFRRFETEVTFILRTFFFLYLGLMFSIRDLKILLAGGCLSILLYLVRSVAVRMTTIRSPLAEERDVISILFARGLAAAILATLLTTFADQNPTLAELSNIYLGVVTSVIFFTSIGSAIGAFIVKRRTKNRRI